VCVFNEPLFITLPF